MPYTRVTAEFGDDPDAADEAEHFLGRIEDELGYFGTVETDTLGAKIVLNFERETDASEAVRKLERDYRIAADITDPETGETR